MKIRATKKVRELLIELDGWFKKIAEQDRILADRSASSSAAMNAGAEKKILTGVLLGVAWRLNRASRGEK